MPARACEWGVSVGERWSVGETTVCEGDDGLCERRRPVRETTACVAHAHWTARRAVPPAVPRRSQRDRRGWKDAENPPRPRHCSPSPPPALTERPSRRLSARSPTPTRRNDAPTATRPAGGYAPSPLTSSPRLSSPCLRPHSSPQRSPRSPPPHLSPHRPPRARTRVTSLLSNQPPPRPGGRAAVRRAEPSRAVPSRARCARLRRDAAG